MKRSRSYFLILLSFWSYTNSTAQIVNIESARMQSDTVGWMGNIGASVLLSQSTSKIFQTNLETHLQYKTRNDQGLWLILGNFGFLKINGDRILSDGLAHLRYNRKLNEWLRWEFFGQFQNNVITQIDSRILLGTGPRFKLVKKKTFHLYAASLFMFEREKERTTPVIVNNDLRNSSYLSFSWIPRENMELNSTTYFQPLLKKISDYRVMNQVSFYLKATQHFGLSLKWNYLHDEFPAGTAPKTNYNFSTGIAFHM